VGLLATLTGPRAAIAIASLLLLTTPLLLPGTAGASLLAEGLGEARSLPETPGEVPRQDIKSLSI
jgi:hypothetical protein